MINRHFSYLCFDNHAVVKTKQIKWPVVLLYIAWVVLLSYTDFENVSITLTER